jgi:redox-sensitive bicupin YhaK (pirin superfamily)
MEVTVLQWWQNAPNAPEPPLSDTTKRYNNTHRERQQQPSTKNKMAEETNLEAALSVVMNMPASDEKAVKIWQLRCKQATSLALEGKSSTVFVFVCR